MPTLRKTMKNAKRISRISLIVVLVALLCATLTACGLFNSLKDIKSADLVAKSGLVQTENADEFEAQAGKEFSFLVEWNNVRIIAPKIEWHIVSDDNDQIATDFADKTKYTGKFASADVGKTFEYYVLINGVVRTQTVKVIVTAATLEAPTIDCENLPVIDGVIQQDVKYLEDVELSASWNAAALDPELVVTAEWFIGGEKVGEGASYTYSVASIKSECTIEITCTIGADGMESKSWAVTLVFVEQYEAVEKVRLSSNDENATVLADGTYYLTGTSDKVKDVSLSAVLSPVTADVNSVCTWKVRNGSNVSTTSGKVEQTLSLSYGKNVITASVDNIESRQIIVYVLSYDADSLPSDMGSAIKDKFLWLGNMCDRYISSQKDANDFVGYAISKHLKGYYFEMYLGVSEWRESNAFQDLVSGAIQQGGDESGYYSYSTSVEGTIGKMKFADKTEFGIPTSAYETTYDVSQANCFLRYSLLAEKRTSLPIDESDETATVATSNELYRAVANGFKPVFADDANGQKLQALYDKARAVLFDYISEDMTDVEKVAAIYDWIVNAVEYDYAVASYAAESRASNYNAFYLEGVFDDMRAVCDGKSKAFALLCGMEGIKAVRVIGYANRNLTTMTDAEKKACGHAWNKVLIDANGDGVKEWYVVDTTWGDVSIKGENNVVTEYLNYTYFLVTDDYMKSTHEARIDSPVADTEYNVYKNTFFVYAGVTYDLYIENALERMALVNYSKANGKLAISVYIALSAQGGTGYATINMEDGQYVLFAT